MNSTTLESETLNTTETAKKIRQELREAFNGYGAYHFSVRTDGTHVRVEWTGAPSAADVKEAVPFPEHISRTHQDGYHENCTAYELADGSFVVASSYRSEEEEPADAVRRIDTTATMVNYKHHFTPEQIRDAVEALAADEFAPDNKNYPRAVDSEWETSGGFDPDALGITIEEYDHRDGLRITIDADRETVWEALRVSDRATAKAEARAKIRRAADRLINS